MLTKHIPRDSTWRFVDIYERSESKTCWVLMVGDARFVPGGCEECGDTLVDLNTRREDDGDCARCGAKGASIFYDGCRDSFTLLQFVAEAVFGDAPETMVCECCKRELAFSYFRCDGNDVCSWCLQVPA